MHMLLCLSQEEVLNLLTLCLYVEAFKHLAWFYATFLTLSPHFLFTLCVFLGKLNIRVTIDIFHCNNKKQADFFNQTFFKTDCSISDRTKLRFSYISSLLSVTWTGCFEYIRLYVNGLCG